MYMSSIRLEIPDALLKTLNQSDDEFASAMRRNHAMELFREAKLTLSQSATLAGMNLGDFIEYLGQHKVSVINYSPEDLRNELASVSKV